MAQGRRYSYCVGYLFTGIQGQLGHGDYQFILNQPLTLEDIEVIRQQLKSELLSRGVLGASLPNERNITILSVSHIGNIDPPSA